MGTEGKAIGPSSLRHPRGHARTAMRRKRRGTTAAQAVSRLAPLFSPHVGPDMGRSLPRLSELLQPLLVRADFVFVHRERDIGLMVRAVRRKLEPTPVEPEANAAGQDHDQHN